MYRKPSPRLRTCETGSTIDRLGLSFLLFGRYETLQKPFLLSLLLSEMIGTESIFSLSNITGLRARTILSTLSFFLHILSSRYLWHRTYATSAEPWTRSSVSCVYRPVSLCFFLPCCVDSRRIYVAYFSVYVYVPVRERPRRAWAVKRVGTHGGND